MGTLLPLGARCAALSGLALRADGACGTERSLGALRAGVAKVTLDALRAGRALLAGRALGALWACIALPAALPGRACLTLLALDALNALDALRAYVALRAALTDGTLRSDGTLCALRSRRATRRSGTTLRTQLTLYTLCALRADGAALTLRSGRSLWAACRADGTLRSSRASRTLRACLSTVPLRPLRALRTLRPCRSPKSRRSDRAWRAIVGRRSNLTLLALSAHRPCYTLRALRALVPDACREHKESHEEEEGDPKTAPPGAARLHVIRIDYPHGKRTFLKEFFRCQDYYSQLAVSRNLRGSFGPHLDIHAPISPSRAEVRGTPAPFGAAPPAYAVAAPARAPPTRAASQPHIIAASRGPSPALYALPSLRRRIHTRPISPSPASSTYASGREPCPHVPGPDGSAVGSAAGPTVGVAVTTIGVGGSGVGSGVDVGSGVAVGVAVGVEVGSGVFVGVGVGVFGSGVGVGVFGSGVGVCVATGVFVGVGVGVCVGGGAGGIAANVSVKLSWICAPAPKKKLSRAVSPSSSRCAVAEPSTAMTWKVTCRLWNLMSGGATFRFLYFPPLVMLAPDWYFCPSSDSILETMLIPSGASLPPMVTVPPMSIGSGGGSSPLCARTCPPGLVSTTANSAAKMTRQRAMATFERCIASGMVFSRI